MAVGHAVGEGVLELGDARARRPRGSAPAARRRPRRSPRRGRRAPGAPARPGRRGRLGRGVAAVGRVDEGGVGQQVGDALEARLLADGQLERGDARRRTSSRSWSSVRWKSARSRSSLLTNTMRGMPSSAQRRHTTSAWTSTPSTALTTNTARSATPQRGLDVADEVGVAGRVDQVDLVAGPLERRDGEGDRDAALLLLGLGVGRGGAVLDPADPVDGARPGPAAPRPASSCRCRRGRPGRRCGSCRSSTSSCRIVDPPEVAVSSACCRGACCRRPAARGTRRWRTLAPGNLIAMFDGRFRAPGGAGRQAHRRRSAAHRPHPGPPHHHRACSWPSRRRSCHRPSGRSAGGLLLGDPAPRCPTCSTAPWPRRRTTPASGARSSTPWSTGSPTCCSSAAWPGTWPPSTAATARSCCPSPSWACRRSSPTSGPRPSRSGLQAKGGLMERAERVILLCIGLLFDSLLVPILWVMLGAHRASPRSSGSSKVWRQAAAAPVVLERQAARRNRRIARHTARAHRRTELRRRRPRP